MLRVFFVSLMLVSSASFGALTKEKVSYSAGADQLESYVAFENGKDGALKPAILIVPDWMGLTALPKSKADDLAKMGYVAMAVDMYGKSQLPKNADEAKAQATKYKSDRPLLRAHIRAAYDKLLTMKNVDPKKVIVMGYCFGGTVALELARSGAPLSGVATFHGGLATPTPQDAKNIKAPVLVMHGADDPYVPPAEVDAFKKEMKDGGVNMKFVSYPGAVHSFTIPDAGNDNSKGAAYNAAADKASWLEFTKFIKTL